MIKIGALYCVYNPSSFLNESVYRIYPVMDKIIFVVSRRPWCGEFKEVEFVKTVSTLMSLPDPDHKFEILIGFWKVEALQRNEGLALLKARGIDWCLIIDDDELFNEKEMKVIIRMLDSAVHAAYLVYHQIYWKNRNTIIEGLFGSFPTFIRTDGTVYFNQDRMILVAKAHTWFSISDSNIVCHHMSYVRSDEAMLCKISNFSHAQDIIPNWYEEKWLKWEMGMTDLHPSVGERFKRAISVLGSRYYLEG